MLVDVEPSIAGQIVGAVLYGDWSGISLKARIDVTPVAVSAGVEYSAS
jgi:hypothetical protein